MRRIVREFEGIRFGRLVAVREAVHKNVYKWYCKCDCGNDAYVSAKNLASSHTRSCGCMRRENKPRLIGGRSHEPEYGCWRALRYNATRNVPKGRVNTIDPRWLESYENFINDMGPRPDQKYRLTRRNRTLPFDKENCYWRAPVR